MKALLLILLGFVSLYADTFDAQLKTYLREKLSMFEKFEYQIVQAPKSYSKMEINSEKNFRLVKNYAYVPVKIYDKQNVVSVSLLTVRVKLFKSVLFSIGNINQNEILTASMFSQKLEDVASFADKVIDPDKLVNKRSRLLIKAGTILTVDMLESIPAINKGDKIVVHAGKDGVDISVDAISRQDGCVGDVISVQSNNKIFKAKVIDKFNLTLVE